MDYKTQCFIGGEWRGSFQTFPIISPRDGKHLADVPLMGRAEAKEAIEAASYAFREWKNETAWTRADKLREWHALIQKNKKRLAAIISAEQGKSEAEAMVEMDFAASYVEWYAEEARRVSGEIIQHPVKGSRGLVIREPVGVVAAITPWNFPAAMVARKLSPALAAGCSIVLKPAEATPLTAIELIALAEEAGFPAGVINLITGNPQEIGKELCESKKVAKLSFTGSTATGRLLLSQCAGTIKKTVMELGGNAPFIIFADANLEEAAKAVIASRFRNHGQACICANRIIVENPVCDELSKRIAKLAAEFPPLPLINRKASEKILGLLDDAKAKGACILLGGNANGNFFEPTVISGVTPGMRIFQEEIFGPVAAICNFQKLDEAVNLANDTEAGLAAYIYSVNLDKAWKTADQIRTGMVGINSIAISAASSPFGGMNQSGMGREGRHFGIEEYLEVKYISMGGF